MRRLNMKINHAMIVLGLTLTGGPAKADDKWDISKLDLSKLPAAADKKDVTFDKDIRPIFQASCVRCHGSERQRGDLQLESLQAVLQGGRSGKVVVPGD